MAQGRSTTIIAMIQWSRTSRLATKITLSYKGPTHRAVAAPADDLRVVPAELHPDHLQGLGFGGSGMRGWGLGLRGWGLGLRVEGY
jgi:hypothetical protein